MQVTLPSGLITGAEAALILGVKCSYVRVLARKGYIPSPTKLQIGDISLNIYAKNDILRYKNLHPRLGMQARRQVA